MSRTRVPERASDPATRSWSLTAYWAKGRAPARADPKRPAYQRTAHGDVALDQLMRVLEADPVYTRITVTPA